MAAHRRNTKTAAALALCALGASGCTTMLSPEEDPVMIRLAEIERRLQSLERKVDNQNLVQLTQDMSALQRQSDELRGQAETLAYNADETATRQRALYADLDARIQALESSVGAMRGGVLETGQLPPGQLPVPGGSDRDNYQAAFELVKEERYDLAVKAFREFLVSFPDSELADNAQYWLGESHYAAKNYQQALTDFSVVLSKYPRSRKVPDALLKMGYCNYNLKRWAEARQTLTRVQSDYPETTAARLAGEYLKRMDADGV
jgi:tol-pal system protein YbgF